MQFQKWLVGPLALVIGFGSVTMASAQKHDPGPKSERSQEIDDGDDDDSRPGVRGDDDKEAGDNNGVRDHGKGRGKGKGQGKGRGHGKGKGKGKVKGKSKAPGRN
jgi:hypothetical protein